MSKEQQMDDGAQDGGAGTPAQEPSAQAVQGAQGDNADTAPPIPDMYWLENIEQLRTIADPLRTRIYEAVVGRAMTAKQLGVALDEAPAKVHYHVRELERVGLVKLVETRERGGILEKYYRAVARILDTPPSLLQAQPNAVLAAARDQLNFVTQGFLRALDHANRLEEVSSSPLMIVASSLWVTNEEYRDLVGRITSILEGYRVRRGIEGEREVYQAMLGYDARIGLGGESSPPPPAAQTVPASPESKRKVAVTLGAVHYSRAYLEATLAEGRQLDLTTFGVCTFADDVTPELIEQAISRFRQRGKLIASKEVRAALKKKEG